MKYYQTKDRKSEVLSQCRHQNKYTLKTIAANKEEKISKFLEELLGRVYPC